MAHDVFISYSNKDKPVADAVVAGLESKGIRCWVAPRDITPGSSWGQAIINAIETSRFMVIILSGNSNRSKQVVREVERAVANDVIIIPFRIENIDPTGAMAYFLSSEHWLDAITPPLERHIEKLQTTLQHFISGGDEAALSANHGPPIAQPAVPAFRRNAMMIVSVLCAIVFLAVVAIVVRSRLKAESPQGVPTDTTSPITLMSTLSPTSTQTPPPLPTFNLVGSWPTSREARNVFVLDDTAYIANGEDGLVILDVSDPSNPQEAGSYPLENAQNVIVVDNIAYVIEQGQVQAGNALSDKLVLIDIKTPSIPRVLGEYTPESGFAHQELSNMAVSDQIVYLTLSDRFIAVDVSEPSQPVTVGEFSFSSNISSPGVVVVDGIAYLQANRLHVVDVRNPAEPIEIGGFDAGWGAGITVHNQIAYIASWSSGLIILDVSDPTRPIKLGQYIELVGNYELLPPGAQSRQTLLDVSVSGDIAYLTYNFGADHSTWTQILESGVIAIDISDPTHPKKIDVYSALDGASGVIAVGDLVFVTDSTRGLMVLSLGLSE
ncbi:MAG: TIR domain-containing protein [Anaerolineales bacterium]